MKAILVGVIKEAEKTNSFYFEPDTPLNYKPGDFVYLNLPLLNYPDLKGNIRHFSIASSPTEGNIIRLTIREGMSGFKKTLLTLKPGANVDLDGPHGVYPWPPQNLVSPHVFIAGGIGITPFRSRIKHIKDNNYKIPITLLYSNQTVQSSAFISEFQNIENNLTGMKTYYFITRQMDIPSNYLPGRINPEILSTVVEKNPTATYWICGKTEFVNSMESMLNRLNVNENMIKTEKFTGY